MRKFFAFATFALLLCLAAGAGAEGQGPGGNQKSSGETPKTTGKTVTKKKDVPINPLQTEKGKQLQTDKNAHGPSKDGKSDHPAKTNNPLKQKGDHHKQHSAQLMRSLNNGSLKANPSQQKALDKLIAQQPLTSDDRQQLSTLLFKGNQAGLSGDDETALSYLLTDDMARNQTAAATADQPLASSTSPMYLRVYNKTTEPIKVWVQVIAPDASADVSKAAFPTALKYELEAGKAYDLHNKGQRLSATVIRIWALSPTQQWAANRDKDLPLTASNASKIYLVTFTPPTTTGGGASASTTSAQKLK